MLCVAVATFSAWRFGASHGRGWLIAAAVATFVGIGLEVSFVIGIVGAALAYAIAEGDIFGRAAGGRASFDTAAGARHRDRGRILLDGC